MGFIKDWKTSEDDTISHRITDFLFSTPREVSDSKMKKALSNLVLIRVFVLTAILGIEAWKVLTAASGSEPWLVFGPIGAIYSISLVNLLWLRISKKPRLVGYFQLFLDVALATAVIYLTDSPASFSLYLVVILGAAFLFGHHGAIAVAALCGLSFAVAVGLLPSLSGRDTAATMADVVIVYVSLIVVSVVASYISKQLTLLGKLNTAQRKNISDLTEQQKQLFNDISEGIVTVNIHGEVTSLNKAMKSILSLNDQEALSLAGEPLSEALKAATGLELDISLKLTSGEPEEFEIDRGAQYPVAKLSYTVRELVDSDGKTSGKILVFNDISHLRHIEERLSLHEHMTKLLAASEEEPEFCNITLDKVQLIGDSPVMKQLFSLIDRVSKSDASILIHGESGTGKELIAKAVHNQGNRKNRSFVAVNCGAIPENLIESELFGHKRGSFTGAINDNPGLFKMAEGGTIFLDEIGELPLHLQSKLLRVLQEKTIRPVGGRMDEVINVRVVAATNRHLKTEVEEGRFREDLYYRLNVVNLFVPPLRERKEDIPALVRYFIGKFCAPDQILPQVSPEALQLLNTHNFPGNIRELENVIERAIVLGGQAILPEHLPDEVKTSRKSIPDNIRLAPSGEKTEFVFLPIDLESELSRIEQDMLLRALQEAGGIKTQAATLLGLNFRSFRYRLKKYNISEDTSPSASD